MVGVQLAVGAERDGVQSVLGAGQLHAVADAERSARALEVIGRLPVVSSLTVCAAWNSATSCGGAPLEGRPDRVAPAPAIETMSGTPITAAPDATAERRPFGESSIATVSRGIDAERRARLQIGVGEGLRAGGVVAGDHDVEGVEVDQVDDGLRHAPQRHRHERGLDAGGLQARAAARGAPGRKGTPLRRQLAHHVVGQVVDDVVDAHPHAGVLEDARGVLEAHPDEPQRLLVRPRAAEALHERGLGRHPVRLGVDEGAVHVPEHGARAGCCVTAPC